MSRIAGILNDTSLPVATHYEDGLDGLDGVKWQDYDGLESSPVSAGLGDQEQNSCHTRGCSENGPTELDLQSYCLRNIVHNFFLD